MIYRAKHEDSFTRLTNELIRSEDLSDSAFRLLIYMLSCADDWSFSLKGLSYQLNWPERKVSRLVNELKKKGHIVQHINFDENGKFLPSTWDIYEDADHGLRISRKASVTQSVTHAKREPRKASPTQSVKRATIRTNNNKELTNSKNEQSREEEKRALGEFQNVFLSDPELTKLKERLGEEKTQKYIDALGDYMREHPRKKYASHYRTIIKWSEKDAAAATPKHCAPGREPEDIDWDEVLKMAEGGNK